MDNKRRRSRLFADCQVFPSSVALSVLINFLVITLLLRINTQTSTTVYRVTAANEENEKIKQIYLDMQDLLDFDFMSRSHSNLTVDSYVPKIIHQRWESYDVPYEIASWIQSWVNMNPGWHYMFWTPRDVYAFLQDHFPDLQLMYNLVPSDIERANIWRYLAMYHYGGLYVDLDMNCLRPIEPWTELNKCILSQEPYEHNLLYDRVNENVINCFFLCPRGHPFFHTLVNSLSDSYKKYFRINDRFDRTGPFFVDRILRRYILDQSSNQNVKELDVLVLPPKFFQPGYDTGAKINLRKLCAGVIANTSSTDTGYKLKARLQCLDLAKRDYSTNITSQAYANHFWLHMNMEENKWKAKSRISIFDLVENVMTYRNVTKESAMNETEVFYPKVISPNEYLRPHDDNSHHKVMSLQTL